MKYVLLIVFITGDGLGGGRTAISQIEFDSHEKCVAAAKQVKEDNKWRSNQPTVSCVAK